MESWSADEYVRAVIVGAVLLATIRWSPDMIAAWRAVRQREAPPPPPIPDWSEISDYVALAAAARAAYRLPVEQFLDGPFRR